MPNPLLVQINSPKWNFFRKSLCQKLPKRESQTQTRTHTHTSCNSSKWVLWIWKISWRIKQNNNKCTNNENTLVDRRKGEKGQKLHIYNSYTYRIHIHTYTNTLSIRTQCENNTTNCTTIKFMSKVVTEANNNHVNEDTLT